MSSNHSSTHKHSSDSTEKGFNPHLLKSQFLRFPTMAYQGLSQSHLLVTFPRKQSLSHKFPTKTSRANLSSSYSSSGSGSSHVPYTVLRCDSCSVSFISVVSCYHAFYSGALLNPTMPLYSFAILFSSAFYHDLWPTYGATTISPMGKMIQITAIHLRATWTLLFCSFSPFSLSPAAAELPTFPPSFLLLSAGSFQWT